MRTLCRALLFLTVFSDDDVVAQAITFFGDGFETSSTALSFSLYALATNPDIQEKVREEVESVLKKHGGELTFDGIQEMTYLDMVFAGMLHAPVESLLTGNFSVICQY